MKLAQRKRQLLLAVALAATLLATYFAPPTEVADVGSPEATSPVTQQAQRAAPAASARLWPAQRDALAEEPGELFAIPPPPAPVRASAAGTRPVPPPAPVAPPLPFVYMGRMVEDGVTTVFLTRNDKSYVVKAGDVLDGQYRVAAINPSGVELVYIPLGTTQLLATAGAAQAAPAPLSARLPAPAAQSTDSAGAPTPDDAELQAEPPDAQAPADLRQKLKQLLNNGANK